MKERTRTGLAWIGLVLIILLFLFGSLLAQWELNHQQDLIDRLEKGLNK